MFYHGNLKEYLMKIFDHLQHLINPKLNYYGTKTKVKFTKNCLKQSGHILIHKKL